MKKFTLSFLMLLMLAVGAAKAQESNNLSFGPIAGFGHSSVSSEIDDEVTDKKFNPSYNLGVRLMYSKHPHWGFGMDVSYRTEGVKVGADSTTLRLRTNYIRVDPKAYYFFGESGKPFRPKVGLGPSLGFFTGGKVANYENGEKTDEETISDFVTKIDLGISGAIGFNYRLSSNTWLNADLAYTYGLMDIKKDNEDEAALRNRSIFLNVGVLFGIGGGKK